MGCKKIEQLIAESLEGDGSPETRLEVERHISRCDRCAQFQKDVEDLRAGLARIPAHRPPEELVRRTRRACHAALAGGSAAGIRTAPPARTDSIPGHIWAALLFLVVLTSVFIVPVLGEFDLNPELSFHNTLALTLVILNALMLSFAPVLIYRYRGKKEDPGLLEYNGNGI